MRLEAGPEMDNPPRDEHVASLHRRLAEAEGAVQALVTGQVDAVLDATGGGALLLQRAQAALRESEARYRWLAAELAEAQQIAHVGSWQWDVLTDRVTCSDELHRILGREPAHPSESWAAFLETIHPDDRANVHAQIMAVLTAPQPFSCDYRLRRADGSLRYLEGRGVVRLDDAGRVVRVLGTCHDVTDRRRAEREQQHKAELEQRVLERTAQLQAANTKLERSQAHLRQLSCHLQSAREAERMRFAREIHDELGQTLTALKMDLAWLRRQLPAGQAALAERVTSMAALLDATVQAVRKITQELRPGILDDLGLLPALEWQLQDFQQRTGLAGHLHTRLDHIDLDPQAATAVFRLFQETLTNIARHAQARRVRVTLSAVDGYLRLAVRDDGRGITDQALAKPKAFGLLGMREQFRLLNGTLTITGRAGRGTRVVACIPLRSPA